MVSYYPEDQSHILLVASIVNWFRDNGYDMIMDKMDSLEMSSRGPATWAEFHIEKAKKVLVFLSQSYLRLYAGDEGDAQGSSDDIKRVWYEMQMIKNTFCYTHSAAKIVCVLMDKKMTTQKLPAWAEVTYCWPEDKEKIAMRLRDTREIEPARVEVKEVV